MTQYPAYQQSLREAQAAARDEEARRAAATEEQERKEEAERAELLGEVLRFIYGIDAHPDSSLWIAPDGVRFRLGQWRSSVYGGFSWEDPDRFGLDGYRFRLVVSLQIPEGYSEDMEDDFVTVTARDSTEPIHPASVQAVYLARAELADAIDTLHEKYEAELSRLNRAKAAPPASVDAPFTKAELQFVQTLHVLLENWIEEREAIINGQ